MIHGTLTVNLDPPYLMFEPSGDGNRPWLARQCTLSEMQQVLAEMGVELWPMRECLIRVQGTFNRSKLNDLGLKPSLIGSRVKKSQVNSQEVCQPA